jgi:aerobic-type carbon monoxide dehydrogenase small subunit (CoxS/CutS family)
MRRRISFVLNGEPIEVEVEPRWTLLYLLREILGLTGAKEGCGMGECGACTVIVNRKAIVSCILPVMEADEKEVWTVEGLSKAFPQDVHPTIHPIQEAFVQEGAVQCGFCTPGMIMSAKALLDEKPNPTDNEIKTAIEGNLCRCGGYVQIIKAIKSAAGSRNP